MAVHAAHLEIRQFAGQSIGLRRLGNVDAELVLPQTGGDVGVGVGVHVRVDAQRHGGGHAELPGHPAQAMQLRQGFDVEAADTDFQGAAHLVVALADAGKHHLAGIAAGSQHPLEFADRDNVETRTQARQHVQYGQIGVGLDRIANQVWAIGKGLVEGVPMALERGA